MGLLTAMEAAVKKPVFGCRMCGQCVLHSTGMTCPMNSPKTLRNGIATLCRRLGIPTHAERVQHGYRSPVAV